MQWSKIFSHNFILLFFIWSMVVYCRINSKMCNQKKLNQLEKFALQFEALFRICHLFWWDCPLWIFSFCTNKSNFVNKTIMVFFNQCCVTKMIFQQGVISLTYQRIRNVLFSLAICCTMMLSCWAAFIWNQYISISN